MRKYSDIVKTVQKKNSNKNNIPHVVPGIYGNENEIVNVIIDDQIGIF